MIKFPYNSGLIIVLRSEGGRPTMWLSLYPGPSVTRTREASVWCHCPILLGRHASPCGGDVKGLRCPPH
jgi:hypothetical protein